MASVWAPVLVVAGIGLAACGDSHSSDGAIVFASGDEQAADIFVLDAPNAGAPVPLTDNGDVDTNPDWSPDGSRIVFTSRREGGLEIYVMGADGTDVVPLTHDRVANGAADWAPDGRRIVYDGFDDDGRLQVYTLAVDAPDATITQLTTDGDNGKAVWSPDATRIAFLSTRDGQREVYVMAADGRDQVNVTNHPGLDVLPAWSSDGARLAFVSDRSGDWEIYTMAADGTDVVRLTHDPGEDSNPTWARGSEEILFTSDRDGDVDVYAMRPDGTDVRNVTRNDVWDWVPDWTPHRDR